MTGLSISTNCVSRGNFPSTSRSDSSVILLDASTRFVRLGIEVGRVGWMVAMRLRASRRVRIRGDSGKFPRIWRSLSVRSIESCGCGKLLVNEGANGRGSGMDEMYVRPQHQGSQSLVLCVLFAGNDNLDINSGSLMIKSVVSVLSKRTSEVKLSLLERVEVRKGVLNEIRR